VPDIPGLAETGFQTNQTLYDLDRVPGALVAVGGGWISVEMAQALARLGSKVTILDRNPRLFGREDPELVELLTGVLRDEGDRDRHRRAGAVNKAIGCRRAQSHHRAAWRRL
jgi:mercuric reductase